MVNRLRSVLALLAAGGVLLSGFSSCARTAVPENGAFAADDGCDRLVLEALARHDDLRWEQRRTPVGPGEVVDTADGFEPGENVHPTRRWIRFRRAEGARGSAKDVLTGLVWERDPRTNERKQRTEFFAVTCAS